MSDNSKFSCIKGFGEECENINYEGISNWFISFRSVFNIYSAHFSYLFIFFCIIVCGLLSLRHSIENGKKYTAYWWGALIHGLVSEMGITASKYWYAQAPIMFFAKQLPLHIIFFYPSIIYLATIAVQRLKLIICVEPAAIGLLVMFLEIPFRMVSVKFLHVTYHDTDQIYYHKLSGVPWVEILSSLTYASAYAAVYHGAKMYRSKDLNTIWDDSSPDKKDVYITLGCGLLSPIAGFLLKIILFHTLYDFFHVNPISCLFFSVALFVAFVVCFETKKVEKHIMEESTGKKFLWFQLLVYFFALLYLSILGKPQNEISIGRHEPVGDCTTLIVSRTPLGKEFQRKKFLCVNDIFDRPNFLYNFNCTSKGAPSINCVWYTICGTPFCNRINFVVMVFSFFLFNFALYTKFLFPRFLRNLSKKSWRSGRRTSNPLKRKKYLCVEDVSSRKNFLYNFECLNEGSPCQNSIWYTICGSAICNKLQFFLNIFSFILLISAFFYKFLPFEREEIFSIEPIKRLYKKVRGQMRSRQQNRPRESAERPQPTPSAFLENPPENATNTPIETTAGFVFVRSDNKFLPEGFQYYQKKTT